MFSDAPEDVKLLHQLNVLSPQVQYKYNNCLVAEMWSTNKLTLPYCTTFITWNKHNILLSNIHFSDVGTQSVFGTFALKKTTQTIVK